jgi:hypothetical protein
MRRLFPTQTQQTITARGSFGGIAGDGMPTHCAALLRQRGITLGAKGIGNVKIAGVPRAVVANGRITAAQAALYTTYGEVSEAAIVDGATGYGFHSGVLSQIDDSFTVIEKSVATPRVVTVHSRQKGVGQ